MTTQDSIGGLSVRWPAGIDEGVLALLTGQNVAVVSTHGRDGTIHSRTVWVDSDGHAVLLNSVQDRQWMRDLDRNPHVNCTVLNSDNPYEFVSIEGRVAEITGEGADAHIDAMAQKYLGESTYPFHDPDNPRRIVRIEAAKILHMAPEDITLG